MSSVLMLVLILITSPVLPYIYGANIAFYSPTSPPPGIPLQGLIAKWWNWWISVPEEKALNWPDCLIGQGGGIGKNESVLFLPNPASANAANTKRLNQNCEIFSNQAIFFPLYNGECDTGQYPEKTDPELKACARDSNYDPHGSDNPPNMNVYVDGKEVTSNKFEIFTSKPFTLIIPEVNAYDIKSGNERTMGGGWYIFLKPLSPGTHEIHSIYETLRRVQNEQGEMKYKLSVLEPQTP